MADQNGGGIAWTDETWNPVRGCSRVSPGCTRCYAERTAARFIGKGQPYEGLAKRTPSGPRWTGVVRVVEKHLRDPLRWTRPRKIFVNSMSDLFHEALPDADILRIFDVMREAHNRGHVFQVLTKRAQRMRQFCSQLNFDAGAIDPPRPHRMFLEDRGLNRQGEPISFTPLMRDLWLGVSVENQKAAEERVPELLATPAAVRWLSVEPQIGPVDLSKWLRNMNYSGTHRGLVSEGNLPPASQSDAEKYRELFRPTGGKYARLHWVVIGGESGPGARPFNAQWARDLVAQCKEAGVAVFVKQLGADVRTRNDDHLTGDYDADGWFLTGDGDVEEDLQGVRDGYQGAEVRIRLRDRAGGDPAEWPKNLRIREYPMAGGTPP